MSTEFKIANAPISYGVYGDVGLPDGGVDRMLGDLAAAGYAGSELGPPDLFGTPAETNRRFRDHGLQVAGSYIPIHFAGSPDLFEADLRSMNQVIENLVACGSAMAIVADEGSDLLLAHPRHGTSLGLSDAQWQTLFDRLRIVTDRLRAEGLEVSFHPHISTFIESSHEIDRLLNGSDITLTFDTGHIFLSGADLSQVCSQWVDRISHVHLKDVISGPMEAAIAQRRQDFNEWWPALNVPLGSGEVDLVGVVNTLTRSGYEGWFVVEQDSAPATESSWAQTTLAQRGNYDWVAQALSDSRP